MVALQLPRQAAQAGQLKSSSTIVARLLLGALLLQGVRLYKKLREVQGMFQFKSVDINQAI